LPANDQTTRTTKAEKRKREAKTASVTTSLSQMSISQLPTKRQRSTTVDDAIMKEKNTNKSTFNNNKPNYLKVPDRVFKQMLSTAMEGAETIVQSLDTTEKLQFARDYAHLVNNVLYLKLEQDFWDNYYKVAMIEGIWSSSLSKQMIKENNLHRFHFKTQDKIEQRRKIVIDRLKQAENELNQHKQRPINGLLDMKRLLTVIPAFVRKGQYKLCAEYERKKVLLQFDANDYRLVKSFYHLKPSEDQVGTTDSLLL
jgi:hypothetical protein